MVLSGLSLGVHTRDTVRSGYCDRRGDGGAGEGIQLGERCREKRGMS